MKLMNIEAERARLGLTRGQMADRLHISKMTYDRYISGVSPIPSDKLTKLADLTGCTTDYLLGLTRR